MVRVPRREGVEHLARAAAMDREVVIDEEDVAKARGVQRRELVEHLADVLVPLLAALVLDDVAELAIEGTAAGRLQRAGERALGRVEVPAGHGRNADVGLAAVIAVGEASGPEIGEQLRRELL